MSEWVFPKVKALGTTKLKSHNQPKKPVKEDCCLACLGLSGATFRLNFGSRFPRGHELDSQALRFSFRPIDGESE